MKGLGATHIEQLKHQYVGLEGPMAKTFGNMPVNFRAAIFGKNGNGKTELCFNMIEQLQRFGRVDFFSYEQGHGPDIAATIKRHKVKERKWDVMFYDPFKNRNPKLSLFEELYNHLDKKKSARFVFVDSVEACEFTKQEYHRLHQRFGANKGFVWLGFEGPNKKPLNALTRMIVGEGDYSIRVTDFIAVVEKSRHGGWADYVVYEEKARERNPLYFELKDKAAEVPKMKVKKTKA
jgi:hypothetical protein